MKNYKLRYLPLFENDLSDAVSYIADVLNNPQAAENLIRETEKAILERAKSPVGFEPYRSAKQRKDIYYRIYVGNYTVFYVMIGDVMEVDVSYTAQEILTDYFKFSRSFIRSGFLIGGNQLAKNKNNTQQSTKQLLGIEGITEYSLKTASNEAVFFSIKPSNISVMSEAGLSAKIYSLMNVLKGLTEIEILCVNSRESFEGNKNHLKALAKKEENPAVRKLLEQDEKHLDHIQALTATAREFLLIVRLRGLKDKEIFSYLNRIEKTLSENGFSAKRYDGEDIKTLLAVYFEQNVTTEKFDDADGERWVLNG